MLVRNCCEPNVANSAHASGLADDELREALRRQERARDLRAQLDFGPYDATEVITLQNSGRWHMARNKLHGDPEGELVWRVLDGAAPKVKHRVRNRPTVPKR